MCLKNPKADSGPADFLVPHVSGCFSMQNANSLEETHGKHSKFVAVGANRFAFCLEHVEHVSNITPCFLPCKTRVVSEDHGRRSKFEEVFSDPFSLRQIDQESEWVDEL